MTKRALDVGLALFLIVVLAPFGLIAALAIRLESRGSVLHRTRRVGRHARPFTLFKLRTMISGADGPPLTVPDDARVTRVGRVLRALHVDEWPQLLNVLRGEMSLVGPRPEDPELVDAGDPRWQFVLSARPGVTGPAQLRFSRTEGALIAGSDPVSSYRRYVLPEKLALDAEYLEQRSAAGDVALLLRTAGRAIGW